MNKKYQTPKLTISQIYDIVMTSYRIYCEWGKNESQWVDADYTTDFKISDVWWTGVTFQNGSCFMTPLASAPKYFIDVILL